MAKFCGFIGFANCSETYEGSGIWTNTIEEKKYFGTICKNYMQNQSTEYVNDDLVFNNDIIILADPYAKNNFTKMKYVVMFGEKWKITSIEVMFPNLKLKIGGVYNEH